MDILEEAASVARAAECDAVAGRFAELLTANPDAAFVFLMMTPTSPGLASLAQWTNATDVGTLFWMLSAAAATTQGYIGHGDDAF